VLVSLFLLLLGVGAIVAGRGYVKAARRMRSFATTRGTVIARGIQSAPSGDTREGRWGQGGGYQPQVTYRYTVDGREYTSDKWSYAFRGSKKALAEQEAAAVPDEVDVFYDPAAPADAYLHTHTPRIGHYFVAGGIVGVLAGLIGVLGSV
jgi:hypothetical protein